MTEGVPVPLRPTGRSVLRADCSSCFALCCVAPAFTASADFAISKPAQQACPNLLADFRCGIHTGLRDAGFRGCTVYDCFGAGQKVAQVTFGGHDWRSTPGTARKMFAVVATVRDLHELLWYLTEAVALTADGPLRGANLTSGLFLTQSQLDAARGDVTTKLPPSRTRPTHW